MKKLFVYRVKSNRWWNILKIHFYQLIGYQIFTWGEHNLPIKKFIPIDFPSAINSVEYEHASRKLSAEYFKNFNRNWSGNIFRLDYIRKSIDISGLDYFAFETTISELSSSGDQVKKIVPPLFHAIHQNKRTTVNFWVIFYYPIWIIKLTLFFVTALTALLSLFI